ncbi:MAG: hypothetical protein MI924_09440 [Chloroflexales bacterium]|nr:hypothetical protein [Chloroflexales bacterium]
MAKRFRRSTATLWRGLRQSVYLDNAGGRYAYTCADDRHTILVALNNHPAPQSIPLPTKGWEIVLASAAASVSKRQVELAAYGGAVLTLAR